MTRELKLKWATIGCFISVYFHYDSTAIFQFLLSLPMKSQNFWRPALKQETPRIEVDMINPFSFTKKGKREQQKYGSSVDPLDTASSSSGEAWTINHQDYNRCLRPTSQNLDATDMSYKFNLLLLPP